MLTGRTTAFDLPPGRYTVSMWHDAEFDEIGGPSRPAGSEVGAAPGAGLLGLASVGTADLVREVRAGFAAPPVERFLTATRMSKKQLSVFAAIPPRSLARSTAKGRLSPEQSDRVLRAARLFEQATAVFGGDPDAARSWLETPARSLGGEAPLAMAATEVGRGRSRRCSAGWSTGSSLERAGVPDRAGEARGDGDRRRGGAEVRGPLEPAGHADGLRGERSRSRSSRCWSTSRGRACSRSTACWSLAFDRRWVHRLRPADLPAGWSESPVPVAAQRWGTNWAKRGGSALLEVPSAVVPTERNLLLNPEHPRFGEVQVVEVRSCRFDPRLVG